MKTTTKKEIVSKAQLLLETIAKRKELEKLEKELKQSFKDYMGEEVALNASGVLITQSEVNRTSLDKDALRQVIDLTDYETTKAYKTMTVKKVS